MTKSKEAALKDFFSSFGIAAYPDTAVPKDVVFPWLTYENKTDAWGGEPVSITVNLWYYSTDEAPPNAKAREISQELGTGGKVVPCEGGYIWFRRGSPFSQSVYDNSSEDAKNIKRRYLNITAEYLTAY